MIQHKKGSILRHYSMILALSVSVFPSFAQGDWENLNDALEKIENGTIGSVEQFLDETPDSFGDNFLLAFDSLSQQSASFTCPRIIRFNEDASLIYAVAGGCNDQIENGIEVISFDNVQKKFDFHSIQFSEDAPPQIENNPESCQACHTQRLRPNWSAYSLWPGFYGTAFAKNYRERSERASAYVAAEEQQLVDFLQSYPRTSRYSFLNTIEIEHPYTKLSFNNLKFTSLVAEKNHESFLHTVSLSPKGRSIMEAIRALYNGRGTTDPEAQDMINRLTPEALQPYLDRFATRFEMAAAADHERIMRTIGSLAYGESTLAESFPTGRFPSLNRNDLEVREASAKVIALIELNSEVSTSLWSTTLLFIDGEAVGADLFSTGSSSGLSTIFRP